MLKRVITALALSAVTLCALLLGRYAMWGLLLLAHLLCTWEMLSVVSSAGVRPAKWVCLLFAAALVPATAFFGITGAFVTILLSVLAAMTCVTLGTEPDQNALFGGLLPAVYPAVPMTALCLLIGREQEDWLVYLYLTLLIPILCDTFALFVGKAFGKHKLIPRVSPNKTVEGAYGGLFGGVLGAFIVWGVAKLIGKVALPPVWVFLLIGLIGAGFSQIGDLAASYIKRTFSVKDFGKIFPGHGGMLDRLDSILFSSVFVYLVLTVFPL